MSKSTTTKQLCQICQNIYFLPFWKTKIQKTCSKKCGNDLQKEVSRKKNERQCQTCSQIFVKDGATTGKFCSKDCYWNSKTRKSDYLCQQRDKQISPVKRVTLCFTCAAKNRTGANHFRWINDRSLLKTSEKKHLDGRYREWAKEVKNRDGWKCKIFNSDCSGRLEAHHILAWRSHPELRYEINNGITLCCRHHPRKESDENRLVLTFRELLTNK